MNWNHNSYLPMEITCMTMVKNVEFYWYAPEALTVTHQIETLAFSRKLLWNISFSSPAGAAFNFSLASWWIFQRFTRLGHFRYPKPSELAGAMEWRGAPPRFNSWMHNSLPSVPFFQPANAINPYTSGYGHFLPVQMLPGLSQINLLNHLHSSGSMMSNDSLQSSQDANQNLFTTAIHPNISGLTGRQVLRAPQTLSEISGFGSAAIPVDIIQKAQKAQKSSPERSRGGNGKLQHV